jgi:hypothetical protein
MDLATALQAFVGERMPREPIGRVALIHLFQDLLRLCGEYSTQESAEAVAHLHWCRIAAAMNFESYRETFLDAHGRQRFAEPSERQVVAERWLRSMLARRVDVVTDDECIEDEGKAGAGKVGAGSAGVLSADEASFALILLADCAVGERAFSSAGLKTFAYFNKADPDASAYDMKKIDRAFQMHAGVLMHISKLAPLNGRMRDVVEEIEAHLRMFWELYSGIWPRIYFGSFFDDRRLADGVAESLRAMTETHSEASTLIHRLGLRLRPQALHRRPPRPGRPRARPRHRLLPTRSRAQRSCGSRPLHRRRTSHSLLRARSPNPRRPAACQGGCEWRGQRWRLRWVRHQ